MKHKNTLIFYLAWMQFAISAILGATIIWGYISFQSSAGQILTTIAESISALSTVVVRTAETVEARQVMLDETQKTLLVTRKLIDEVKAIVLNQTNLVPQYAAEIKEYSQPLNQVGDSLQNLGVKIKNFSLPNVKMDGVKPVIAMTKPFEDEGKKLQDAGAKASETGRKLAEYSDLIGRDAKKFTVAYIATSDQLIKVIDETEKSLSRIKENDLPKAISELKHASGALSDVGASIGLISNLGPVLLLIGLLITLWGMVQSLGLIVFVRAQPNG